MGNSGFISANQINKIDSWFDIDQDDQFAQMSLYSQLFKTEQAIKVTQVFYDYKPYGPIVLAYSIADIEKKLTLDSNNSFGFTFQ